VTGGTAHANGALPKPEALQVLPDGIPERLKQRRGWLMWRYVLKADGSKWDKPPMQPNGTAAASTRAGTWVSWGEAWAAYCSHEWDGVGYATDEADGVVGIDFDKAIDPDSGELLPWATELLSLLGPTYAELSPSGEGVRAFVIARKPGGIGCRVEYGGGRVEVYGRAQYLTVTGHRLAGAPAEVAESQAGLEALCHKVWGEPKAKAEPEPKSKSNGRVFRLATSCACPFQLTEAEAARWKCIGPAKQARVIALHKGEVGGWDNDDSRADAALARYLLIIANGDRERAEQLFGESELAKREKWTEREDYRARTFDFAEDGFTPWQDDPADRKSGGKRQTKAAADDEPATAPADAEDTETPGHRIFEWSDKKYRPTHRLGAKLHSATLGREFGRSEIAPDFDIIDALAREFLIDRKSGQPNFDAAPRLFRDWLPVAWGELLKKYKEEGAGGEVVASAADDFKVRLTNLLKTRVSIGGYYNRGEADRTDLQNKPLIAHAVAFAKPRWADVRDLDIWSRKEPDGRIRVAFRAGLIGELSKTGEWGRITHDRLSDLCQHYGLGSPCFVQGKKYRAIEVATEFVEELLATMTEKGRVAPTEPPKQDTRTAPPPAREANERPSVRNRSEVQEESGFSDGREAGRCDSDPHERPAERPAEAGRKAGRSDAKGVERPAERPAKGEKVSHGDSSLSEGEGLPASPCDDGSGGNPFEMTAEPWGY
jgi:hypothetical protein